MGVDGCGWVSMGAVGCRGTGGHKNKTIRDKNGRTGRCFGAMAGEISPNIMFYDVKAQRDTDGCRWVTMGVDRCNRVYDYGRNVKQYKKSHKWARRTIFGDV